MSAARSTRHATDRGAPNGRPEIAHRSLASFRFNECWAAQVASAERGFVFHVQGAALTYSPFHDFNANVPSGWDSSRKCSQGPMAVRVAVRHLLFSQHM